MSLTAKDVAEITKLLEESDFDELCLELDGMKLNLRRRGAPPVAEGRPAAGAGPVVAGVQRVATAAQSAEPAEPDAASDPLEHRVAAPLLGTFYRSPKPGAPPFVEVGSEVEPDTVIGIIEVMKLMNTARAGVHGRVTRILARDGVLVEYGETLLLVSRIA